MSILDFHIIPVGLQPAGLDDLLHNAVELGKSIALLFGANFLSTSTYPSDPLRYAIALLAFAALAATLLAAARQIVRRSDPTLVAYACYWAASVVLLGLAYWSTNQAEGGGPGGGLNYLLTLAPAAGVGVALLAYGSRTGRIAASVAIAVVGAVNIAGVANGHAEEHVSAQGRGRELIRLLEREGVTHGYAPYWDAQSLTWKSGMKVFAAPVRACNQRSRALCRDEFFTIDSWYDTRPGPSFLIVDPAAGLSTRPPRTLGRPSQVHRLAADADVTVYVYPYDLARYIRR